MTLRRLATASPLLCLAALPACSGANTDTPFLVRDSAGVEIVENTAPAWNDRSAWTVSPQPALEIGRQRGDPAYQFDQIAGVIRLGDGRLVVADGGSSEIRIFDESGAVVSRVGGRGGGPGEFETMATIGRGDGDTFWVYDFSLRRLSFFTADGDLQHSATLDHEIQTLNVTGRLDDGSFILHQLWGSARSGERVTIGLRRDPVVYARFAADGALLDTIGRFPGLEINVTQENGRLVMGSALFGRSSSSATAGTAVFIGDQERFEIGAYAADGSLQRFIRIPGVDLSIAPAELESLKERQVAAAPDYQRASRRAYLEEVEVPPTRPAYQYLLVDETGNLWASEYARPPDLPVEWTVLDARGRWLGSVVMPRRFRPYQIGDSWVLGVAWDELDVESVRLYELRKPD